MRKRKEQRNYYFPMSGADMTTIAKLQSKAVVEIFSEHGTIGL